MKLNEILENWKKDCEIQTDRLDLESLNIPSLHHKYLKILSEERINLKKLDVEKKKISQNLWIYYTGKASPEIYKNKPLTGDLISNTKIKDYIEVDEEYIKITQYIDIINEKIDVLIEIMKEINNRAFKIKNAIEWQKFINGTN